MRTAEEARLEALERKLELYITLYRAELVRLSEAEQRVRDLYGR